MAKRQKRLTRRQKIEASRQQRIEEQAALKQAVASLGDRVAALEAPNVEPAKPVGRPKRDFIGMKKGGSE